MTKPTPGFSVAGNFTLLPPINNESVGEGTLELKGFGLATECTTGTDAIELHTVVTSSMLENHGIGKLTLDGFHCLYLGSKIAESAVTADLRLDMGGVKGVAGAKGSLKGWIGAGAMDLEGSGTVTLPIAPNISGQFLQSSTGYAACASFGWFLGGFGGLWTDTAPQTFTGCDFGPWRPPVPVAADAAATAAGARAPVPGGLPLEGFMARGADGPPRVALVGPGGARFTAPADGHLIKTPQVVIGTSVPERAVFFVVRHPARGAWRIVNLDVADRATTLSVAQGTSDPAIHASVSRHGHRVRLRYRMRTARGLRVQFVEVAGGLRRPIGSARAGARGTITFTPLAVRSRRHAIEALVVRSGIPSPERVVARFSIHVPGRPGKIRMLRVRRSHGALAIRFAAAANAASYLVELTDSSLHTFRTVAVRPRLTVRAVPAGRLTLRIKAFDVLGRSGPVLTRRIT